MKKIEPVAWMNPHGGVLQERRTGLEQTTYSIQLYTESQLRAARAEDQARIKELTDALGSIAKDDRGSADDLREEAKEALSASSAQDYSALAAIEAGYQAEILRLHGVCRAVYEVWAGSDGIPEPITIVEGYLLRLVEQMRDEATDGLSTKPADYSALNEALAREDERLAGECDEEAGEWGTDTDGWHAARACAGRLREEAAAHRAKGGRIL